MYTCARAPASPVRLVVTPEERAGTRLSWQGSIRQFASKRHSNRNQLTGTARSCQRLSLRHARHKELSQPTPPAKRLRRRTTKVPALQGDDRTPNLQGQSDLREPPVLAAYGDDRVPRTDDREVADLARARREGVRDVGVGPPSVGPRRAGCRWRRPLLARAARRSLPLRPRGRLRRRCRLWKRRAVLPTGPSCTALPWLRRIPRPRRREDDPRRWSSYQGIWRRSRKKQPLGP